MPNGKGGTARKRVMNTYAIASLGGATMNNEWNCAHQKLFHALGINLFLLGTAGAKTSLVRAAAVLVLVGGAAPRISLVLAGQR